MKDYKVEIQLTGNEMLFLQSLLLGAKDYMDFNPNEVVVGMQTIMKALKAVDEALTKCVK